MPPNARARSASHGAARRTRRRSSRLLRLTAVYTSCPEGGFAAEIIEADTLVSQGETLDEARENLADALRLMLEEAPAQVGRRPRNHPLPPYTVQETLFVVLPAPAPARKA